MNRRNFLQCLGAAVAGAALPSVFAGEKIVRAPEWAEEVVLFRTSAPLAAGNYTFTAGAGEFGTYFGGVKALGGETLFEMPKLTGCAYTEPCLKLGGIALTYGSEGSYAPPPDRGDAVTPELK